MSFKESQKEHGNDFLIDINHTNTHIPKNELQ